MALQKRSINLLIALSMLAGLNLLFAGCSQSVYYDGPQRVAVEGRITLDGEPVENGVIVFTGGRQAGGTIVNGTYEIKESQGPEAGVNKVRFSVKKGTGEFERAEDGEMDEVFAEVLPDKYIQDTGIEVEFKAGRVGQFDFDLSLSSKDEE